MSKKIILHLLSFLTIFTIFLSLGSLTHTNAATMCSGPGNTLDNVPACTSIDTGELGFKIPSLGDILTFVIRAFFVIAGLAALFYMLIGAFSWITSGGDKDAVGAARDKIQAAVVGMILIVAVLAVVWTLEQVIFKRRICLGLSCPVTLPGLIETSSGASFCCVCPDTNNTEIIDAYDTNNAFNHCGP